MLSVGLDTRAAQPGFKSHFGRGTGRYATELIKLLPGLAEEEGGVRVAPLSLDVLRGSPLERRFISALPAGRETVESQFRLPRRLRASKVDLVHFFAHGDAPAWGGFPTIVTVLDLIPLKFRELYRGTNENWRYHLARYLELGAIQRARGIVAISEATKRDLIEILQIPENKILVTPLAVEERFLPTADKTSVRSELGLPTDKQLLLYVGGIDPRKNVRFLLEVFKEVTTKLPETRLILSGKHETDKFFPELQAKISELQLEPYLIRTGFFPDEKLPLLYQAADLFMFPSLYEGFGLPVLEAARSGVPVVAGRNSSIPELLGESYPLLEDNALAEWVEFVINLLADEAKRVELIQTGIQRGALFSWARTAELTLEAYRKFGGEA